MALTKLDGQFERRGLARPLEMMLSSYAPLAPSDLEQIRAGLADVQVHANGARVGGPASCRLVLSGWVASSIHLPDGRRQIVALAVAGDLLDTPSADDLEMMDVAMGPARTADATGLIRAVRGLNDQEGLGAAWTAARRAAEGRHIHHVLRLGRLSAYERAASLLVELHDRQRRAGLCEDDGMSLPLTQEILSDILGLSVVHVNRTLQQLRRDELIVYRNGRMLFPDLAALTVASGAQALDRT